MKHKIVFISLGVLTLLGAGIAYLATTYELNIDGRSVSAQAINARSVDQRFEKAIAGGSLKPKISLEDAQQSFVISMQLEPFISSDTRSFDAVERDILIANTQIVNLAYEKSQLGIFIKKTKSYELEQKLVQILEERKKDVVMLAHQDISAVENVQFAPELLRGFSQAVQNIVEEKVELMGTTQVGHLDNFEGEEMVSEQMLMMNTDDGLIYTLKAQDTFQDGALFDTTLQGYRIGPGLIGAITLSSFTGRRSVVSHTEQGKLAVFMINFADSPAKPFTRQELQRRIFGGDVNNFFREQSYGRFEFTGQVFNWIDVPVNGAGDCHANTQSFGPGSVLDQFITDANIDMNDFEYVTIVYNCDGNNGGWAITSPFNFNINGSLYPLLLATVFVDQNSFQLLGDVWGMLDFVLAHELGHNLSVKHASSFDCGAASIAFWCSKSEYGNHFDVMGIPRLASHFNFHFKELIGWLLPQEILNITQSGIYTINDLETSGGIKGANIYDADGDPAYSVELRQGYGYDQALNEPHLSSNQGGLLINDISSWLYNSILIDTTPQQNVSAWQDQESVSLNPPSHVNDPQNIFSDPRKGITIRPIFNPQISPLGQVQKEMTFEVDIAPVGCVHEPPFFENFWTMGGHGEQLYPGDSAVFHYKVINADYPQCPPSPLHVNVSYSSSWNATSSLSLYNPIIYPESRWTADEQITVPSTVAPGYYTINLEIINTVSGLSTLEAISVRVY